MKFGITGESRDGDNLGHHGGVVGSAEPIVPDKALDYSLDEDSLDDGVVGVGNGEDLDCRISAQRCLAVALHQEVPDGIAKRPF